MFVGAHSKELGWLYVRYLSAWLCIVTVDYMMEVRLEYAWPFLLLLRSVKDTYTYKGLVGVNRGYLHLGSNTKIKNHIN